MQNNGKKRNRSRISKIILGVLIFIILLIAAYMLPPIHSRLAWRVESLIASIKFRIQPPDQILFLPTQDSIETGTPTDAFAATATPSPTMDLSTPGFTPTPSLVLTQIPAVVNLPNVVYVDQRNRWNYCGPSNLTMALKYWGWPGNRDDVAKVVKPGIQDKSLNFIEQGKSDKNVMPYELTDFIQDYTSYNVVLRYGGDIDLLKRLVAAGFPVVAEKGYYEADYTGKVGWLGHYQFVTGYDDGAQSLIVQDTWLDGPNFRIKYDLFANGWRSFDYIFFIVYPPDRELEVMRLLGQWSDPVWSYQHALALADQDVQTLKGIDLFFTWFNRGTSLVKLTRYSEAADAYDMAFNLYAGLRTDNQQRPYRMMWYQTGPYMAYYYSGRYGDVINLAHITLETVSPATLEESFYWRGMAEYALGQTEEGISDLRESIKLNMNFKAGLQMLKTLGVEP
jgi:tetratricopeptide (TPR) repeat protein